jgi:hypothetical protein
MILMYFSFAFVLSKVPKNGNCINGFGNFYLQLITPFAIRYGSKI